MIYFASKSKQASSFYKFSLCKVIMSQLLETLIKIWHQNKPYNDNSDVTLCKPHHQLAVGYYKTKTETKVLCKSKDQNHKNQMVETKTKVEYKTKD